MISRPTGLRARLVTVFALVAAITSVAVAGTSFVLVREASLRRAVDTRTQDAGLLLDEAAPELPDSPSLEEVRFQLAGLQSPFRFDVVVQDAIDGESLPGDSLTIEDVPPALLRSVADGRAASVRVQHDGELAVIVGSPVSTDGPSAYLVYPLSGLADDLASLRAILLWSSTAAVLVSAVIGWAAASGLLRPLRRAHSAAQRLATGSLDTRIPEAGHDEFADLAKAFNEMAETLQRTVAGLQAMEADHRRFVSDVSHELRTPLTALSAAGGVLEASTQGLSPRGLRAAHLLVRETRRLATLVEDLMEISRFDAGTASMAWDMLDVGESVRNTLETRRWTELAALDVQGDVLILADPRRLDAITANLVGNALEHGRQPVTVRVVGEAHQVRIDVADAGDGIALEDADRVFDRFYKSPTSRERAGSGLGLAIARENAQLHDGDVTVSIRSPRGSTFTVVLPRHSTTAM